ncbi:MAG TPA: hypothetical protein VMV08_01925 [Gaiellaceae bacterium]|nr:hypothetical protein [Gaiellaceae bacterium]
MIKQAFTAGLVALVIAVAVPSALAAGVSVTPANGNDFILPDGTVYQQNDDGTFSWVPNVATATAMGITIDVLQPVPEFDGEVVAPFPSVLGLANASFNRLGGSAGGASSGGVTVTPTNGNDYLLPKGQIFQDNGDGSCSWVPDTATASAMGITWDDLTLVDDLSQVGGGAGCTVGTPFPHVD